MLLERMDEGWVKISSLENYIIIISIFYIISFNRRSRCHPSLICKKIYLARDKQQTIKSVSTNLATSFKKNNVNACAARFFCLLLKKSSLEFSGHYPHTSFISLFNHETRSPRSHSTSAVMQTSRNFFFQDEKDNEKVTSWTIINYYPLLSTHIIHCHPFPFNQETRSLDQISLHKCSRANFPRLFL